MELLKIGRQFRLSPRAKLTLGRNEDDNAAIRTQLREGTLLVRACGIAGPLGLISGTPDDSDLRAAGALVASYGKGKDLNQVTVAFSQDAQGEEATLLSVAPMDRQAAAALQVQ